MAAAASGFLCVEDSLDAPAPTSSSRPQMTLIGAQDCVAPSGFMCLDDDSRAVPQIAKKTASKTATKVKTVVKKKTVVVAAPSRTSSGFLCIEDPSDKSSQKMVVRDQGKKVASRTTTTSTAFLCVEDSSATKRGGTHGTMQKAAATPCLRVDAIPSSHLKYASLPADVPCVDLPIAASLDDLVSATMGQLVAIRAPLVLARVAELRKGGATQAIVRIREEATRSAVAIELRTELIGLDTAHVELPGGTVWSEVLVGRRHVALGEGDEEAWRTVRSFRAASHCPRAMTLLDRVHRDVLARLDLREASMPRISAVRAVAGGGKTTLLMDLARRHASSKILYVAFNRAIVTEIQGRAKAARLTNLHPTTFDGLVYRYYRERLRETTHCEDADLVLTELRPHVLQERYTWLQRVPPGIAQGMIRQFEKFCGVPDEVNAATLFPGKKTAALQQMWEDTRRGDLWTFDGMRKMAQVDHALRGLLRRHDLIFVDEAQDFDPLMLRILLDDAGVVPIVFVGDPRQQVYSWRGSINAFERLPSDACSLELYATHRIGAPACAEIARLTGAPIVPAATSTRTTTLTVGTALPMPPGSHATLDPPSVSPPPRAFQQARAHVYLFRSWRRLLQTARVTRSVWIHDFAAKMRTLKMLHERLSSGRRVAPGEWEDDLPAFVTKLSASDLATLEAGIRANLVHTEHDAQCRMYTVHGFKGMEHANVRIAGDVCARTDASLHYVALTRAMERLHLDPVPPPSAKASSSRSRAAKVADATATATTTLDAAGQALRERLRTFRTQRARAQSVPAYCVFSNKTMDLLAAARPQSLDALSQINGIGAGTLRSHGVEILKAIVAASS